VTTGARQRWDPRRTAVIALNAVLWTAVIVAAGWIGVRALREHAETNRTTERYDPPVMAGQPIIPGCPGGFYARDGRTVVVTVSAHCLEPGTTIRDADGRLIGVTGRRAQLDDCPDGRFCAPSDFMPFVLGADRIPWGHLNVVDMGAGGYRTLEAGTRALACGDLAPGARVETDGREHYREGRILVVGPYSNAVDTIFPCMAIADILVAVGDSGGSVLVEGQPAGVIARTMGGKMGFTPLAEGLENLGLVLCTTPDCDLSPDAAEQPAG
jgi:hypothetical protein